MGRGVAEVGKASKGAAWAGVGLGYLGTGGDRGGEVGDGQEDGLVVEDEPAGTHDEPLVTEDCSDGLGWLCRLEHLELVHHEVAVGDIGIPDGLAFAPLVGGKPGDAAAADRGEGAHEDAFAPDGDREPVGLELGERLAGSHPGDLICGHEVVLAGELITGGVAAGVDVCPELVRDPAVLGGLLPWQISRHARAPYPVQTGGSRTSLETLDISRDVALRYISRDVREKGNELMRAGIEPLRLHLGCGAVYLDRWVNVDAVGVRADEHPDLAREHATDLDNYFKRPYKRRELGHEEREFNVVDVHADVLSMPMFADDTVDEILTVNVVDHLRFQDLPVAVAEWRRVLKPTGSLIIDVGDARGNAELLVEAQTRDELEWALRLFYCHSRDPFDCHHWGYTPEYLRELMAEWGFVQLWTRDDWIDHIYPSLQSCFRPSPSWSSATVSAPGAGTPQRREAKQ